MKYNTLLIICLTIGSLIFSVGCSSTGGIKKTLNKVTGQATYNPSTYGVAALFNVLEDNTSSRGNAVAAATELSKRNLTNDDGIRLAKTLNIHNNERVQLSILNAIETQNMAYLLPQLVDFFPKADGRESTAKTAALIVQYMPSDEELFVFVSEQAIDSPHANVRARAAKYLSTYGADATPVLLESIKTETSATAALAMVEGLIDFGGEPGYNALVKIQNDVSREFKSDDYLKEYGKVTADMVRAQAVKAVEEMRSQY